MRLLSPVGGPGAIVFIFAAPEPEVKEVVRTSSSRPCGRQGAHDGVVGPVHKEAVSSEFSAQRVVTLC